MMETTVNARITPSGGMDVLSKSEVSRLRDATQNESLKPLFRRCALAVLTTGSESDDAKATLERFPDFDIRVLQQDRGIKIELDNAPATAFVDGKIITGIAELLFAVLRDIIYISTDVLGSGKFDLTKSEHITNAVFEILRNAKVLRPTNEPSLVVCWGGHSINRVEYEYTKNVGYQLGLRGLDICTGCGPGAMKGPMKGATIAHAKMRRRKNRYIGITEPGIIAAESPNPIVNSLVIMPDIEKRLEAFVRVGHAIVVFPGGVGTAEEILYLLGILLNPDNASMPFPLVFAGPRDSRAYFEQIDAFLVTALGHEIRQRYKIIVGDAAEVGRYVKASIAQVRDYRVALKVRKEFQEPFVPTHANMAGLNLHRDQEKHLLAANLRRAFSGIVAGNVKEEGIRAIAQHGLFELHGEPELMGPMDALLRAFVDQQRMKLPSAAGYQPCYRLVPKAP
jgi:pyrimidine/purine-5'-nucleotide nucleosidase